MHTFQMLSFRFGSESSSAIQDVTKSVTRRALDAEMSVGLGSDIAGGYSLSIQSSMRQAVITARLREGQRQEQLHNEETVKDDVNLRVDWKESLYLATKGGKKALDLGGCFDVGMEFDAQLSEFQVISWREWLT